VPLAEAIKLLVRGREEQKSWGQFDMRPDVQSYTLMEECLLWVAVLHRQVYLAALLLQELLRR
jgi:hypothetical protein